MHSTATSRLLAADLDVDMAAEQAPTSPVADTTDGSDSSPTAQQPSSKWRKPTYIVRKEEKAELLHELEHLQARLLELQQAESEASASAEANRKRNLLQQELEVSLMRDAVRAQQLSLVQAQSAVSGYVSVQEAVPHEVTISLGADLTQRRDTLLAIRPRKMRDALAYLSERTRFLNPFRPFCERSRFMLDSGDYCALSVEITPLDGERVTVCQVYDAMVSYVADMEMQLTVVLGDITTRDETDYGVQGMQQSRFVSSLACGARVEMNTVTNYAFVERSDEHADGGPLAVFTTDYVDHDELYPYRPQDRLRQDVTVVSTVQSHSRKQYDAVAKKEVEQTVVDLTHAYFVKLHRSDIVLPPDVEHTLREQIGRWGSVMIRSVIDQVHAH